MAKDLKEQIEIMTHYLNGGEVECTDVGGEWWRVLDDPQWNWDEYDYRIKEQKQKVTIEKWLCLDKQGNYIIVETSNIDGYRYLEKVKLIESYKIEL